MQPSDNRLHREASTEELLDRAKALYQTLVDASTRLSAFTEMLRASLDSMPSDEEADDDAGADDVRT